MKIFTIRAFFAWDGSIDFVASCLVLISELLLIFSSYDMFNLNVCIFISEENTSCSFLFFNIFIIELIKKPKVVSLWYSYIHVLSTCLMALCRAAVIKLKYCRYVVIHYLIYQSIVIHCWILTFPVIRNDNCIRYFP